MERAVIEEYARGAEAVPSAIAELAPRDFAACPVPGTWTIGQIVLHLMDSDLIASDRIKRIIAEDEPLLIGYNETAFAARLFYHELDPFRAAEVFRLNRLLTAEIFRRLPAEAFGRLGRHNERGRIALGELIGMYVQHLEHHLRFLRHKRQLLGK